MNKQKLHYAWIILAAGVLGVMGALGLARFGYTVILPAMREGLSLNYGQMGLLGTGNLVGYLCFSLLGGFLASRHGPKVVIIWSLALVAVSLLVTGWVGGLFTALAVRTVTGAGSAGSNVPIMGLASAWFAPKRRGLAAGILVAGSGFGVLLTGSFLPKVIEAYGADGWRWAWYYLAALAAAITLVCWLLLKDSPAEKDLTPYGAEDVPSPPPHPESSSRGDPAGRRATPTSPLNWGLVYKNSSLWHLGLVYFAFGFSYIIYATFFIKHVMEAGQLSQGQAGGIWSLVGLVSLLSGFIWGGISDYIGRRAALVIVFILHTVAFSLFAYSTTTAGFYVSAMAFGISAWSIPSIMAAFSGDIVGARLAPAALGMVTVIFGVGQGLGPYIAGVLRDQTGTFLYPFILASVVAFLGAVGALFLKNK